MNDNFTKQVYVVKTNTDLTEGRGRERVVEVCETLTTAKRIGKGAYVQGTNCPIVTEDAVLIGRRWFIPVSIVAPNNDDKKDARKDKVLNSALKKIKAAGLTEEELKELSI